MTIYLNDWVKEAYRYRRHHERYKRFVESMKPQLICQACRGAGEYGSWNWDEPSDPCGWCESTGLVTRWQRGHWLRFMKELKYEQGQDGKENG